MYVTQKKSNTQELYNNMIEILHKYPSEFYEEYMNNWYQKVQYLLSKWEKPDQQQRIS